MEELMITSIGIGLVISLFFSEIFGVAAGGMVVPGYFALHLDRPVTILMTLIVAFLAYGLVHMVSAFTIIYGRRRTVLMIIAGFFLGTLIREFGQPSLLSMGVEFEVVGYIIPGLIAIWIDRQGLIETTSVLLISSVVVRLGLILFSGGELLL